MLTFTQYVSEAMQDFEVRETPAEKKSRQNRKYTNIVRVHAGKFKDEWEKQHGEKLDWHPTRKDRIREYPHLNGHPQVYTDHTGNVDVLDGRHRISVAAERGQSIHVATPKHVKLPSHVLA